MKSGGGIPGNGRNPTVPPPTSRPTSSSSASPSSSSSALSAHGNLGFESMQQLQLQQQQQQLQQQQQQQQQQQHLAFRQVSASLARFVSDTLEVVFARGRCASCMGI